MIKQLKLGSQNWVVNIPHVHSFLTSSPPSLQVHRRSTWKGILPPLETVCGPKAHAMKDEQRFSTLGENFAIFPFSLSCVNSLETSAQAPRKPGIRDSVHTYWTGGMNQKYICVLATLKFGDGVICCINETMPLLNDSTGTGYLQRNSRNNSL